LTVVAWKYHIVECIPNRGCSAMSTEAEALEEFYQEILKEIEISEDESGTDRIRESKYADLMINYLSDAEILDGGHVCYHKSKGAKVNGYFLTDDGDTLDLFAVVGTFDGEVQTLKKNEYEASFKRMRSFLEESLNGFYEYLDKDSSEVYDLAYQIYQGRDNINKVRFYLFSDRRSKVANIENDELKEIEISHHIWDISRLYQIISAENERESITVDFVQISGEAIPCLETPQTSVEYKCYLATLSGSVLVELYSQHGSRLLERNVRCFLQVKGNVNQGIRDTIMEEPGKFLAYNNGLAVVAEGVETVELEGGGIGIARMHNFQIINGGQTTGSLFSAFHKDKADVSGIYVPIKVTEIVSEDSVELIAPQISKYANSQNKISAADFTANHFFHRRIEELSRRVLSPAREGSQVQTYWFYERSRGQYLEAKGRERTPARKKKWTEQHPSNQKLAKTDVAKYENTWAQHPHLVSRGAQRNFIEFMMMIDNRDLKIDTAYFKRLIAKAILFKQTEKIVSAQKFGGYRANIVTYTLAWLSHNTAQRIDMNALWRNQDVTPALREAIERICKQAYTHIVDAPGGANVTEWCKKTECWDKFKSIHIDLPDNFYNELVSHGQHGAIDRGITMVSREEQEVIDEICRVPFNTWFEISKWAKKTGNLTNWERRLAYNLGSLIRAGNQPTVVQATDGNKILEEVGRVGYDVVVSDSK
jgi:hypothetical protein